MNDDDDDDDPHKRPYEAFMRDIVWPLERKAKRHGGCLKWVPTKPTALKAYAAKMYRRLSFLGWDISSVVPPEGAVCAFTPDQWVKYQALWDAYDVMRKSRGRLRLAVVVGSSVQVLQDQAFVFDPVEV